VTAVVGILCQDGVVVGTDSSATFSAGIHRTIEQETKKIEIVSDRIIIAGTGQVGLGQRFKRIVDKENQSNKFQKKTTETAIEVATHLYRETIKDFISPFQPISPYPIPPPGHSALPPLNEYGAVLAFPLGKEMYLCEFAIQGFQPELKTEHMWFVSMGSGQPITDPFLGFLRKIFWKERAPTLSEGILAATWALQHAIELNPGGINGPIQLAILSIDTQTSKPKAKILPDSDLQEHNESVKAVEAYLAKYPKEVQSESAKKIPEPS